MSLLARLTAPRCPHCGRRDDGTRGWVRWDEIDGTHSPYVTGQAAVREALDLYRLEVQASRLVSRGQLRPDESAGAMIRCCPGCRGLIGDPVQAADWLLALADDRA